MGWADCGEDDLGRPIGYIYKTACDAPQCDEEINLGLGHACGGMHGDEGIAGSPGCPRYYCGEHHNPAHHDCPQMEEWLQYYEKEEVESALRFLKASLLDKPRDSWQHQLGQRALVQLEKARDARNKVDLDAALETDLGKKQHDRGYSDGKVGHSPAQLRGPYMVGYIKGKTYGKP